MALTVDPCPVPLELSHPLLVRLFKVRPARLLSESPVRVADFADVVSEAWRDGCLRAGHPEVPLADVPMRLSPMFATESASRCAGFKIRLRLPNGRSTQRLFTFYCLRHVAERAAAPLLEAGVLEAGEAYHFEVAVSAGPAAPPQSSPASGGVAISIRSKPLAYLTLPLRPLLARASPIALRHDDVPPVFFTREAFARAEACARRGMPAQIESGCAVFGSLALCPDSGEFFSIIHDVVEIEEAEEKQFSLAYSGRSWMRLQKIQQARQAAFPAHADRLLGQAHGHPFRPSDGKLCADCAARPTCTLHSAWASPDDEIWHKSAFARQPWALCGIFGLSARGDSVHQLFGLRDGRLQARGYYLLPDFSFPGTIPQQTQV